MIRKCWMEGKLNTDRNNKVAKENRLERYPCKKR